MKPAGVSRVYVKLWGGGGGGSGAWGGGGGGYCEGIVTVSGNVNIAVGRGGALNVAGTASSFMTLTAGGGQKGSNTNGDGGSASGGALNVSGTSAIGIQGGRAPFGGNGGFADVKGAVPGSGGGDDSGGADGLVIVYY